jgi:predicted GNAT family acetyltransferase
MKFTKYDNTESFGADTLDILMENEVQNNLPISFIQNEHDYVTSRWLLATIKDEEGYVVLTAACTPPFNIVMYETGNHPNGAAVKLLSDELKSMNYTLPGVLAEQGLARHFAETHTGTNGFHLHTSMNIMRLDKVNEITKAPGFARLLCEDDLFFLPYWELAFNMDCRLDEGGLQDKVNQVKARINRNYQYIWEDGHPVSQAYQSKKTPNGAGISGVYTPPHYRNKGYASSVVSELSRILLENGNKFCFLFADAENPISCGIYRKIGYRDLCVFDEIKFDKGNNLKSD